MTTATTTPAAAQPWLAFHLHYHADLDRLLCELVRPMLGELIGAGHIDRFFFVRYGLGGPHVRLRLRVSGSTMDAVRDRVADRARAFFAACPSTESLSEDEIRRINASVLGTDAHESDGAVYPDNSAREAPFHPELDRYGGPALLDLSLAYFALSSAEALRFAGAHGAAPRSRQLPVILRIRLREAWAMAADAGELIELLSFAVDAAGPSMAAAVARGDQLFDQREEVFVHLLRTEIAGAGPAESGSPDPVDLAGAAGLLAGALAQVDGATRRRVLSSQVHMTANRLGLKNPEEVYVARLLWRAARAYGDGALTAAMDARERVSSDIDARSRLDQLAATALAHPSLYAP